MAHLPPRRLAAFWVALAAVSATARADNPKVVIEVNRTPEGTDDYITWSPVACTARLVGSDADLTVVLTNDTPKPAGDPTGPDGDVVFAPDPLDPRAIARGDTTLSLLLTRDGAPRTFYLAGRFGRPSTNGQDAVIEARRGTAAGPKLGPAHPVMVRVRKNANKLTPGERNKLLAALDTVHRANGRYIPLYYVHRSWSGLTQANLEAHGGPAFLPWHRTFLLELERRLQAVDPSVALPYWKFDEDAPNLFSQDFMGSNLVGQGAVPGDASTADVKFATSNPLYFWSIEGSTTIPRSGFTDHVHTANNFPGFGPRVSENQLIAQFTAYPSMAYMVEGNPHGFIHVWAGGAGWLGNPDTAVKDPLFFLLHANIDRLWAKWQFINRALNVGGNAYDPAGAFGGPNHASWPPSAFRPPRQGGFPVHKGHYLDDTMWPWDGSGGNGNPATPDDDRPPPGIDSVLPGPVGVASGPPATPRPRDLIDYFGIAGHSAGCGFCYDDLPYAP